MPFGKSAEEKAAERAAREAEAARAAEAQRRAAFLASPVGRATTAKEKGRRFFEIQLVVGASERSTSVFDSAGSTSGSASSIDHAETLAGIEDAGWRLEHVGYLFMVIGESTHNRMFSGGENIAVNGQTVGIYLFRNTDALRDTDAPAGSGIA